MAGREQYRAPDPLGISWNPRDTKSFQAWNHHIPMDAQMDRSMFLSLPPELRLRIYEHALHFDDTLQRPLRAAAWRRFDGYVANISLLCTSKLVHKEAKDVFYEVNNFIVSYNHICCCENEYPYSALEQRMGEMRIVNFLPRINDEEWTCSFCQTSGLGLLEHLLQLPKLRSVSIAFDDVWSFADFAPTLLSRLAAEHDSSLVSDEVGRIDVLGLRMGLRIELPALYRAWAALARGERKKHARYRVPGEQTMRRALEYLSFEANTYDRTAATLAPFFVPRQEDGMRVLRFRGLEHEGKKRAEFTVALAGVMNDIFADDGGSGSVSWVELGGKDDNRSDRWRFSEEKDAPKGVIHMGFRDEPDLDL